jgi:porin
MVVFTMRSLPAFLFVCAIAIAGAQAIAQTAHPVEQVSDSIAQKINWDSLDIKGTDAGVPPFSETILGQDSELRKALALNGVALRIDTAGNYFQNMLDGPVAKDQQNYIGQRQTWMGMINPILTYDMRAFGLKHAQLNISAGMNHSSWRPNGPNAIVLQTLYLYKAFAKDRIEVKAGYLSNDWEYLCLYVGGSAAAGVQGVYAVLPYEAGLSRFPLPAPGFNLRVQLTKSFYAKGGLQRSLDPDGQTTINRNRTGLRFAPKGDKLLVIGESGYKKEASEQGYLTWVRGGYLHNATEYTNFRTGGKSPGNWSAYLLADRQLTHGAGSNAANGLYAGLSLIADPAKMNVYSRYVEARLYKEGTFSTRPRDMASLVATYTAYSSDFTRLLESQKASYWRGATTISANYIYSLRRGVYAGLGATFNTAPAVTPRVSHAFVPTAQLMYFF